ncbi:hypothetical protein BH10PSE1_BH10PSE1_01640 [soil metagenome]
MATEQSPDPTPARVTPARGGLRPEDYPVREYIAGMALELAQMARWDGDDVLATLLEAAVTRAESARP